MSIRRGLQWVPVGKDDRGRVHRELSFTKPKSEEATRTVGLMPLVVERTPASQGSDRASPHDDSALHLEIERLAQRRDPLVHSLLPRVLIDPHGEGWIRVTGDGRHD